MSEWGWVAFAYTVAYGSLTVYVGSIVLRMRNARKAIGENE